MSNHIDISHTLHQIGSRIKALREEHDMEILDPVKGSEYASVRHLAKRLLNPLCGSYPDLQLLDIIIIAFLWHDMVEDNDDQQIPMDLLKEICGPDPKRVKYLDNLVRLLDLQILYSSNKIIDPLFGIVTLRQNPFSYNKLMLLDSTVALDRDFLARLLKEASPAEEKLDEPYRSNDEYLQDWFAYLSSLDELRFHDFGERRPGAKLDGHIATDIVTAMKWRKRIKARTELTEEVYPLMDLMAEYELDDTDSTILMYLVKCDLDESRVDQEDVLKIISQTHQEMYLNREHISGDGKLVQNGLIEVPEETVFRTRGTDIRVMPDVTRRIIMRQAVDDDERLKQILHGDDLFTLLEPHQTLEDLILRQDLKSTIATALNRYYGNVDATLREWRLYEGATAVKSAVKTVVEPGLLMLLHGPPGTGKTFAAGAIASALGKKLIVTDMSRIQSKYVGESEKNVRRLFATYERIVRRVSNPPVLLFNEADQFLGKRFDQTRSAVDVMHNTMQNLFLEAFERLRGVMIATTNLRENLDPAFSRRFHLKLELPTPGPEEREQLWKLHIPPSIPGSDQIDHSVLASRYTLTGGQIAVIVQNASTEAASRRANKRRLTLEDLEKYCEIECSSSYEGRQRNFGFSA